MTAAAQAARRPSGDGGLRIEGTGWPGIVTMFQASPGDRYLVRADTRQTRDGDLLYLGHVAAAAGPLAVGVVVVGHRGAADQAIRGFPAIARSRPRRRLCRVLVYSEAPRTDFVISSLDIYRLRPQTDIDAGR